MGTEKDLAALRDDVTFLGETVSGLLKIILDGQVEMQALEMALVERHGLSLETLQECRVHVQQKRDAMRTALESATQRLARFQGPPQ